MVERSCPALSFSNFKLFYIPLNKKLKFKYLDIKKLILIYVVQNLRLLTTNYARENDYGLRDLKCY